MNGGMRVIVPCEWSGKTAEEYLKKEHGVSRRLLIKLKRTEGGIIRNGELLRTVDIINEGDVIEITFEEEGKSLEPNGGIFVPVVFENDDFVVFNKPAGMPVHPSIRHHSDTLGNYFSYLYKELSFRPVNRLDRDTSGLCFVTKNAHAAHWFSKKLQKTYYAVVSGKINEKGEIRAPIGRVDDSVILRCVREDGQPAATFYEPVEYKNNHTLLKIRLETGRTHQIRVHFSYIGYPLDGDSFYGGDCTYIKRQALHCGELKIPMKDGGELSLCAPLPEDIKALLGNTSE